MFADPCPVQAQASSLWGIVQSAISAASGLIGVAIGALFTALNQKKQRKNDRTQASDQTDQDAQRHDMASMDLEPSHDIVQGVWNVSG